MKRSIALFLVCVLAVTALFAGCSGKREDKKKSTYAAEVEAMGIWDNKVDEALPQTVIHKLVMDHFAALLPKGKTVKKAIFIGYDGYRADGLENIKDSKESAIMTVKSMGGLYHSFSGGVAGKNEQHTSTAPSWMAMLTGGWGDYNGITDNGQEKKASVDTFLTSQAKAGHAVSFTTSWREHTALSYRPDIVASIQNGWPAEYTHQIDDAATYYQILKYVAKPAGEKKTAQEDPDCMFFTLEFADHAGHDTGYGNNNDDYVQACKDADAYGYSIIKTIEARSTYDTEDWLIVISTDHGGTHTGHGGQTPFERMTWIACNKSIPMTEDYLSYAVK